jgi:hypothetical protein
MFRRFEVLASSLGKNSALISTSRTDGSGVMFSSQELQTLLEPISSTRSSSKNQGSGRDSVNGYNMCQAVIDARPNSKARLDFVKIGFKDTVQDVDGVNHIASVSSSFAPRALRDRLMIKTTTAIHL